MTRRAWWMLAIAACSRGAASSDPPPSPPVAPPPPQIDAPVAITSLAGCERIPFAETIPLAEASGAAWLPDRTILVVSDSGNDGAYVIIDAGRGAVLHSGQLPLGEIGDDLEGIALVGDQLWAITSSGWMRAWKSHAGKGYELVVRPYRIDDEGACPLDAVNCGDNYEGLCLRPEAAAALDGCVGYAAAKTSGDLVCLVADEAGRFVAAPDRRIHVSNRESLADCDISADGTVWTGDNLFGRNSVRRVVKGSVVDSASLGEGFPEAMTVAPDGTIYRFSDTGGAPSRATAYRCAPTP